MKNTQLEENQEPMTEFSPGEAITTAESAPQTRTARAQDLPRIVYDERIFEQDDLESWLLPI